MSETIEGRLLSLKSKRQDASRRRATAEAKLDEVASRKAQVLQKLKEQGFDNPEDASKEVQALTEQVDSILDEISEKVSGL